MKYYLPSSFVSQTYNCNAYGGGNYGQCATTTTGSPSTGSQKLDYFGYEVIVPVSLGLAVVIAAAILLAKKIRRRSKKSND